MSTIKDVAVKMQVSEHTLRFWDKSGFFPFVTRDQNNNRNFSENDFMWVYVVKCLKNAGADNKSIKKYIDLCIIGDSTIAKRHEIIRSTRLKAEEKMEEIIKQMEVLNRKEIYYKAMMENEQNDKFNPINLKQNLDLFLSQSLNDN